MLCRCPTTKLKCGRVPKSYPKEPYHVMAQSKHRSYFSSSARSSLAAAITRAENSERWFEALVASSSDFLTVFDSSGALTYANPSCVRVFSPDSNESPHFSIFDIIHPDDHLLATSLFAAALSHPGPTDPVVLRFRAADGQWRYIESVLTSCLDDPAVNGIVSNGHDVTERIHLQRAFETLTRANQVLFNATDPNDLLSDVVKAVASPAGFPLAWLALSSPAGLAPRACAGLVDDTSDLRLDLSKVSPLDPVGRAILTMAPQTQNDLAALKALVPWVARALELGLRSVLVLPLGLANDNFGVLCIYARDPNTFGHAEIVTLSDLARDLGFAFTRLLTLRELDASRLIVAQTEQRFKLAFESNSAPMIFTDLDDKVFAANDAFCNMVGLTRDVILGQDSTPFTHPEDRGITESYHQRVTFSDVNSVKYTKRYLHPDGHTIIVEVSKSPARDPEGNILYYVISERDITEAQNLTEQLTYQALHDPLTGLANRALFDDRISQLLAKLSRTSDLKGAVLLIDLDGFKQINDTHGHLFGDHLLKELASRLLGVTRSSDTLCRFGGDEFLYLASDISSTHEATQIASRILSALEEPFNIDGHSILQHASIGVAIADSNTASGPALLASADAALYDTKRRSPGFYNLAAPTDSVIPPLYKRLPPV